jgi:hypothetical protein
VLLTDEPPEPEVFILPAACLDRPDEIDRAQQLLHDEAISLIAQDGGRRRGPIEWRHWHGRDGCLSTLAALFADDTRPVVASGLAQFRAFFDEYPADCVLVVASCEVSR